MTASVRLSDAIDAVSRMDIEGLDAVKFAIDARRKAIATEVREARLAWIAEMSATAHERELVTGGRAVVRDDRFTYAFAMQEVVVAEVGEAMSRVYPVGTKDDQVPFATALLHNYQLIPL